MTFKKRAIILKLKARSSSMCHIFIIVQNSLNDFELNRMSKSSIKETVTEMKPIAEATGIRFTSMLTFCSQFYQFVINLTFKAELKYN